MKKKVLLIGIDAATPNLVERWVKEGKLPNLAKFYEQGSWGKLKSTDPPLSPVAWSSLATGREPGGHGVLDFVIREPISYQVRPINARERGVESFWDILSKRGRKVIVHNLPLTYPPDRVNGVMVSGWLAPHERRDFTYPRELLGELESKLGKYEIYPRSLYSKGKGELFIKELERVLELEYKTADYLMKNKEWDLMVTIFFGVDLIQHYLWHCLDKNHPNYDQDEAEQYGQAILKYYQQVDKRVGKLLKGIDKETVAMVVSDHGAGSHYRSIYLNYWLWEKGYLKLKKGVLLSRLKQILWRNGLTFSRMHQLVDRLGLTGLVEKKYLGGTKIFAHGLVKRLFLSFEDVDWERTKAYALGRYYGSIFVNLQGREPQGIVKPGQEYESLIKELAGKAREMGESLVGEIYRREELYQGPFINRAADLVLVAKRKEDAFFGLTDFGSNQLVEKVHRTTGSHREEGILLVKGKGISKGEVKGAKISDVAPTVLALMGEKMPGEMTGRRLEIKSWNGQRRSRFRFELDNKVRESKKIIMEAYKKFGAEKMAIAWTGGKDSTVILHLTRTLFEGKVVFPVFFNDSTVEFDEVYEFIQQVRDRWQLNLLTVVDKEGVKLLRQARDKEERLKICREMKINAIEQALQVYDFKAFMVGIRWDEHKARSKEKVFSKRQDHDRVHPILNWTEMDIWNYIKCFEVPYVSLYDNGYRSLGEAPLTKPAKWGGDERSGREIDKEKMMVKLRKAGYW